MALPLDKLGADDSPNVARPLIGAAPGAVAVALRAGAG
jgi:hypothetical protein